MEMDTDDEDENDSDKDTSEEETYTPPFNASKDSARRLSSSSTSSYSFRQHDKAHNIDVEVYNSILVAGFPFFPRGVTTL